MSARRGDVLERNLRALLTRAYVPVWPSAAFRARLERELAPWIGGCRRAARRIVAGAWLAAAGLALAGLVGWRALVGPEAHPGGREPAPLARLLSAGEVALRELPAGEWRAATAAERREGIAWSAPAEPAAGLELATPPGLGIELRDGEGLAVALGPASRARLARGNEASLLHLDQGALELRAPARPALVRTPQGSVLLAQASARVALEPLEYAPAYPLPALVAVLSGRARLSVERDELAAPALELAAPALELAAPALELAASAFELAAPGRAWMHGGALHLLDEARPSATDPAPGDDDPPRRSALPDPAPAGSESARLDPPREAPSPAPATLTGVVRAREGAEPLPRFELTLLRAVSLPNVAWPDSRTFEDPAGHFEWAGLEPGEYSVFVQAEGYAAWRTRGLALAANARVELEVALVSGASLRGVVVERGTGLPIAGALVVSESDAPVQVLALDAELLPTEVRAHASSSSDGSFELAQLAPGPHVLRASAPGHAQVRARGIELRAGERLDGLLFELDPGGAIEGRVEGEGGLPRVGARVIASEALGFSQGVSSFGTTTTDAEGSYRIAGLGPGSYVVLVTSDDEHHDESTLFDLSAVELGAGGTARVDFLRQTDNAALRGRVLDARGEPLPGATVNLTRAGKRELSAWRAATAGPDGGYALEDIEPGSYLIHLGAGSGIIHRETISLAAGQELERDYALTGSSLAGRISAADGGAPIPGHVLLLAERSGAQAGRAFPATGAWFGKSWPGGGVEYEFPFLPPGLYDLVAFDEGGEYALALVEAIELGADRPARVDFALRRGGGAQVFVTAVDGSAVAAAAIELRDPLGRHIDLFDRRTDAAGSARFDGLAPGLWRVSVAAEGRSATDVPLVIDAGERRELRLVLRP